MAAQNPLSPAALTVGDIRPGLQFLWYTPLDDESLKWGTFRSAPYFDTQEYHVVDVTLDFDVDRTQTLSLTDMGITPSPDNEQQWANCLTILRGESE